MYILLLTNVIPDPIPMAAVVGVTLAILIIFLVLVIALLIAYKKEKMCFKSEYNILEYIHTSLASIME